MNVLQNTRRQFLVSAASLVVLPLIDLQIPNDALLGFDDTFVDTPVDPPLEHFRKIEVLLDHDAGPTWCEYDWALLTAGMTVRIPECGPAESVITDLMKSDSGEIIGFIA